jgi:hypothetical protein
VLAAGNRKHGATTAEALPAIQEDTVTTAGALPAIAAGGVTAANGFPVGGDRTGGVANGSSAGVGRTCGVARDLSAGADRSCVRCVGRLAGGARRSAVGRRTVMPGSQWLQLASTSSASRSSVDFRCGRARAPAGARRAALRPGELRVREPAGDDPRAGQLLDSRLLSEGLPMRPRNRCLGTTVGLAILAAAALLALACGGATDDEPTGVGGAATGGTMPSGGAKSGGATALAVRLPAGPVPVGPRRARVHWLPAVVPPRSCRPAAPAERCTSATSVRGRHRADRLVGPADLPRWLPTVRLQLR